MNPAANPLSNRGISGTGSRGRRQHHHNPLNMTSKGMEPTMYKTKILATSVALSMAIGLGGCAYPPT